MVSATTTWCGSPTSRMSTTSTGPSCTSPRGPSGTAATSWRWSTPWSTPPCSTFTRAGRPAKWREIGSLENLQCPYYYYSSPQGCRPRMWRPKAGESLGGFAASILPIFCFLLQKILKKVFSLQFKRVKCAISCTSHKSYSLKVIIPICFNTCSCLSNPTKIYLSENVLLLPSGSCLGDSCRSQRVQPRHLRCFTSPPKSQGHFQKVFLLETHVRTSILFLVLYTTVHSA